MHITIGKKLIFGYLIVILLMAVLTLYATHVSQRSLEESVGKNSMFLAAEILKRIDHDLYAIFEDVKIYAIGLSVNKTISRSNQAFENLENAQEYIKKKDAEWVAAPKEAITPFMQRVINNELSYKLKQKFILFPERQRGHTHFAEVFVANKYGANVAQTGKTSDYRQDDKKWWQISRREGYYVGDIEYDESVRAISIPFVVRLDDEQGNFIGIIKAAVSIMNIVREAEIATRMYETTDIKLICQTHKKLIYSTKTFQLLEDVSGKGFFKKITQGKGFFITEEGKRKKLFSYAHLKDFGKFEGLKWVLMVGHDVAEILKPAFVLRNRILTASFILTAMGILVAFLMSRSITKPLTGVRNAAAEISQGNLDKKIEVTSRDEIGQLAHAFNDMTDKLKVSYSGLEKRVRERTKELEKAIKELESEITVRKEAEEELAKHREHLEELIRERTAELEKRVLEVEQLNSAMVNLLADLRVSNESLELTTRQLSDANKELEAFSYSVSHDLRAPLRSVDGFSQILLEDYSDTLDEKGKHYLERARAGTQKMGQLIDDILNLSRIGRQPMEMKKINMKSIAREVYNSLEDEWKGRKVDFNVHKCPPADADLNLIKIVFMNLLSNALKFTGNRKEAKIEVGSETKDEQTVFFVKDNGAGFDMQYADKLFTPFQRLHRVEEYEGTGIGLAIVQRIIHRHSGRIWPESKVGKGTTFYFTV